MAEAEKALVRTYVLLREQPGAAADLINPNLQFRAGQVKEGSESTYGVVTRQTYQGKSAAVKVRHNHLAVTIADTLVCLQLCQAKKATQVSHMQQMCLIAAAQYSQGEL
jgi:hypothetical protein